MRQPRKVRYPATEKNGAARVNANTKRCQVFEKLKLLRKMSARSAEITDSNMAKAVTMEKTTVATLSNKLVFFSMLISQPTCG
jgi:hypothetical protein